MIAETLAWIILALVVIVFLLFLRLKKLNGMLQKTLFDKKSMSVRYGRMSEQFFPFMKSYPYDARNFRFIGSPVDGIQFEKERIVFVEFKTGDSRLSSRQKEIRELVRKKKVGFEEVSIR
jgi:predicted Holliday junction resolvase-like endonuclease